MQRLPLLRTLMLPAALLSAAAIAVPALAQSDDGAPPPHEWNGHHRPMPPFARALHQVGLTDAQKTQIHDLMKASHQSMREQFQSLKQAHDAFDRAVPGTSDFSTAQTNLAQAEAAAAQAHVQQEADLHTKIYALLTDAQKSQLATVLTQLQGQGAPAN